MGKKVNIMVGCQNARCYVFYALVMGFMPNVITSVFLKQVSTLKTKIQIYFVLLN